MSAVVAILGVLGAAGLVVRLDRQRLDTLTPPALLEWLRQARAAGIREVGVGKLRFVLDPPEAEGHRVRLATTPLGKIPVEEKVLSPEEAEQAEWDLVSRSAR